MSEWFEKQYIEWMTEHRLRVTQQRLDLVRQIASINGSFDAELLIQVLPEKGKTGFVTRPTIYRTLTELVESGILHMTQIDGRTRYFRMV